MAVSLSFNPLFRQFSDQLGQHLCFFSRRRQNSRTRRINRVELVTAYGESSSKEQRERWFVKVLQSRPAATPFFFFAYFILWFFFFFFGCLSLYSELFTHLIDHQHFSYAIGPLIKTDTIVRDSLNPPRIISFVCVGCPAGLYVYGYNHK